MQCTMSTPSGSKSCVEHWTLLTLNGRHLGYVEEGEGPPTYENGGRELKQVKARSLLFMFNKTELKSSEQTSRQIFWWATIAVKCWR